MNQSSMSQKASRGHRVVPFPRMRELVLDAGWMSRRRHMMHGFLEVDITKPRQLLREYKSEYGHSLSFTAFVLACVGRAVAVDPSVQACRYWRNQLVIFDDVDVLIAFEIAVGDRTFPLVHPVRATNRRSILDMHQEIRSIQKNPRGSEGMQRSLQRWFFLLPTFVRRTIYRLVLRNPHWFRSFAGTVGLTSVGMFGKGIGWGVGMPNHPLAITLGGIGQRVKRVDDGLESREILCMTISFDHDVVDGAPAARFASHLTELIESAAGLDEVGASGAPQKVRSRTARPGLP